MQPAKRDREKLLDEDFARAGYTNASATLTKAALLRNLDIATKLGCLNDSGLPAMPRGKSSIVRKGRSECASKMGFANDERC
jgi:hypothetical protein